MERMKARAGFTLAEVLIACGVLSLLLLALFGVFRSGSSGFSSGQWQIQTQKKAQLFLAQLRELLEKGNNAESYSSGMTPTVTALPIFVKTGFHNTVVPLTGPTGLLYFSVTTAYSARNDLIGAPENRGTWSGVSLAATNDSEGIGYKLILTRSGAATDHIRCGPPYTEALAGANFNAEPASRRVVIELGNVQSIGFSDAERGTVEITIVLSRNFGGGRTASVRESVRAKLLNSDMQLTDNSF